MPPCQSRQRQPFQGDGLQRGRVRAGHGQRGDNALDNDAASDAGRIANIAEVPPGNGTVSFNISVAAQSAELGLNFRGFKARSYPGGAFGGNSPLLGIEEEGCDIYADLECADRYLGK